MFKNVLVGVDGRASGRDAIALASQLTEPGGAITFAHVIPGVFKPLHAVVPGRVQDDREQAERLLEEERAKASIDAKLAVVQAPSPGQGLHEHAEVLDADLLVLGTCRHGIVGRAVLGNDTRASINGAPCAIAVAPLGYAEHPHALHTIAVGYDRSNEAKAALAAGKALAEQTHAKVRARQVVSIPYTGWVGPIGIGIDEMIDEAQAYMGDLPDVHGDAVYGLTSEELAVFGGECDILIVGSRGYGPARRLMLGSTSNNLQGRARGPLLIIPRGTRYSDAAASDERGRAQEPVPA
ncbi:MAG TPA: universal stress protein [Solirubrobacteraceae bacterium]|nr:universal stress protein [Solirubrobacteraceae bacterium]